MTIITGTEIIHPELETGSISSSGNTSDNDRLRSIGYLTFEKIKYMDPKNIKLTVTVNTGKVVMVNLLGYNSNTTNSALFDLYWYNNGYSFDVSSYFSNLKYVRIVLKYSDGSALSLSDVTDCTLEMSYSYEERWIPGAPGEFPTNVNFPSNIPSIIMQNPDVPTAVYKSTDINKNEGFLYHDLMKIVKISTTEFSDALWRCEDGINDGFPFHIMMKVNKMNPDNLPYALFRCAHGINEDLPYHKLMKLTMEGSFADATNLEEVKVPQSVKSIGPYAFYNTNITEVTISRDCVYFDTSFPPGCVIKFY